MSEPTVTVDAATGDVTIRCGEWETTRSGEHLASYIRLIDSLAVTSPAAHVYRREAEVIRAALSAAGLPPVPNIGITQRKKK